MKRKLLVLMVVVTIASSIVAQTYVYDGDLLTTGIQNGAGTWSTNGAVSTNLRWLKDGVYSAWDNSGLAIAEFGTNATTTGGAITVEGEILVAGMNFNPLGTPLGANAYLFTGGTLNFGTGSVINIANGASGGGLGGQWITFNSQLKGENLTIQKSTGTATGFVRLGAANPNLTGTLTLASAPGVTSGIYLSVGSPTYIGGLSAIDVKAGSIFNPTGAGNFTARLYIAGAGASNYGAIRVDGSGTTLSGGIVLTADARLHTHINTINTIVSGGISEAGGSWGFTRTAYAPTTTLSPLTATFKAASDYTGATTFGRATNIASTTETTGTEGGTNILDFTDVNAPTEDLLYHDKSPGALVLIGGLATQTVLRLEGAKDKDNVQRFASLSVQQSATAIVVNSGTCGSMDLELGNISRTGNAVVAIKGPAQGQITANVGGVTEGLIGTWATYSSADGKTAGWAGLTAGVVGVFSGDLDYQSGVNVGELSGFTSASHLRVSADSSGDVLAGSSGTLTDMATVSMTDATVDRRLLFSGGTLRLAAAGGIQILAGARSLDVGQAPGDGMLTAGGADATPGQILLTNMSGQGVLTINSTILDNGASSVSLNINGSGRTVLTAANMFTGIVAVQSGVLEVRHGEALGATGTTGITKIMTGASLNLSGGIMLGETIQVNGHGIALDGAIRNLSGTNTIATTVRMQSTTRFASDSGLLVLGGGISSQISATSYTFSGSGDIEVRGAITATSGVLTKEGSGTLTLTGTSNASGTTTVSNGTLHLNFDGMGAPAANILYTGVTPGAFILSGGTLRATGKANSASSQTLGALTLGAGYSRISAMSTGSGSMDITFGTITKSSGATVRFDLPASGAIKTTSGTDNALLTGTGGVAYATVGGDDWAATSAAVSGARSIVGLSTLNGYTASTASTLAGNADIASGVANTTLEASATLGSLRFNQNQATTITVGSGNILATGGILVTSNVGANTSIIDGGSLRAAAGSSELVIFQNNTAAPLVITGHILNAVAGTSLTKAGAGTLVLKYNTGYVSGTDYTGNTRIQDGALQLVKTTSTSISYYLYAGTNFYLGSGASSGRLILGGTTDGGYGVTQYGGLNIQGTGANNAVVGGNASMSTFLHYVSGVHDFRKGFIGGSGTYENNLNLTISLGTLQLGDFNTYRGKTTLLQNTIEVTKLANRGETSSLGTGDANATAHIIDMATATTSSQNFSAIATLRYIGDTDSVTDRPLNVSNGDIATDVVSVVAILENTGTGTVKFTSGFTAGGVNTVDRVLRLGGTNTGENEIVSFADASAAVGKLEKVGTGRWILTGDSTYTGSTTISEGTLQLGNGGSSGMVGMGDISIGDCAVLATNRSDTFTIFNQISGEGSLVVNNAPTGTTVLDNVGNTYSGGTHVNTGTLMVNNTYGTGSGTGTGGVRVEAAAVLAGNGYITPGAGNSVVVRGTLSVGEFSYGGAGMHIQTSGGGSFTLAAGAEVVLDLVSGTGDGMLNSSYDSDVLVLGGNVVIESNSTLRVENLNGLTGWMVGDAWQIIDWATLGGTTLTGSFTYVELPELTGMYKWDTSALYTSGVIAVALVPEPGRAMLLMIALMMATLHRRRR